MTAPRDDETPEFGPSGYLPRRAASRARKIVLRSPLGLQWVLGSVLAGVVIVVAGVLFLTNAFGGPPGEPFVHVGETDALGDARLLEERGVLVVTAGGPAAFAVDGLDAVPRYCPASRRLESATGRVWSLTGRGLDGGPSLAPHPVAVHAGSVYVDPASTLPRPAPVDEGVTPACGRG